MNNKNHRTFLILLIAGLLSFDVHSGPIIEICERAMLKFTRVSPPVQKAVRRKYTTRMKLALENTLYGEKIEIPSEDEMLVFFDLYENFGVSIFAYVEYLKNYRGPVDQRVQRLQSLQSFFRIIKTKNLKKKSVLIEEESAHNAVSKLAFEAMSFLSSIYGNGFQLKLFSGNTTSFEFDPNSKGREVLKFRFNRDESLCYTWQILFFEDFLRVIPLQISDEEKEKATLYGQKILKEKFNIQNPTDDEIEFFRIYLMSMRLENSLSYYLSSIASKLREISPSFSDKKVQEKILNAAVFNSKGVAEHTQTLKSLIENGPDRIIKILDQIQRDYSLKSYDELLEDIGINNTIIDQIMAW